MLVVGPMTHSKMTLTMYVASLPNNPSYWIRPQPSFNKSPNNYGADMFRSVSTRNHLCHQPIALPPSKQLSSSYGAHDMHRWPPLATWNELRSPSSEAYGSYPCRYVVLLLPEFGWRPSHAMKETAQPTISLPDHPYGPAKC